MLYQTELHGDNFGVLRRLRTVSSTLGNVISQSNVFNTLTEHIYKFGDPDRIRTDDILADNELLYQLSYGTIFFIVLVQVDRHLLPILRLLRMYHHRLFVFVHLMNSLMLQNHLLYNTKVLV